MNIEKQVGLAIARIQIEPGERILIGVSGGPDSVALLHLMIELRAQFGFEVIAVHFNHHLRGEESDRDERFVRELCQRLGVQLIVGHAEGLSESHGNIEERARDARHAFIMDTAAESGATRIALGHHRDDQAETVLMRLMRGAGAAGLGGMAPVTPQGIIRPLLGVPRTAIRRYLAKIGASFVIDSSNESSEMLRNRIRHQLMPSIERDFAAGFARRLSELTDSMRDLDELVTDLARTEIAARLQANGELDLAGFAKMNPALVSAVIRTLIEARLGTLRRVGRTHIETLRRLCVEGPNGSIDLPWGWIARRSYNRLSLYKVDASSSVVGLYDEVIAREGITTIASCGYVFESSILPRRDGPVSANADSASFDAERIETGLRARNFRAGDRIAPMGLGGYRKVKKIFIEARLPIAERRVFPLLTLEEEIAWLPGIKRGSVALITPETRWIMRIDASRLDRAVDSTLD